MTAPTTQKQLAARYSAADKQALINLYVTNHALYGSPPTPEEAAKFLQKPTSVVLSALQDDDLKEKLARRGISLDPNSALTAQQIAVANVLLDFNDTRTQAVKLRACGVNSQTYQGWLSNPIFNSYLRQRAERLLDANGVAAAHTALLQQTQRGNMQAVKLMYEVTGRHKDSTALNVEYFLQRVIETVSLHVKDPATLKAIAEDFTVLLEETK